MKKFVLAAASAAAVIAAAAPASAAVYVSNLGTISTVPQSFRPGFDISTGDVDVLITFNLAVATAVNASSFTSSPPPVDFASAGIFAGTFTARPTGTAIASSTNQMSINGSNFISIAPTILSAGNYTIAVRGTATGATSVGSSVSFTAVPEPATWGVMLLGFGMIGAGVRMRRRSTSVRFA